MNLLYDKYECMIPQLCSQKEQIDIDLKRVPCVGSGWRDKTGVHDNYQIYYMFLNWNLIPNFLSQQHGRCVIVPVKQKAPTPPTFHTPARSTTPKYHIASSLGHNLLNSLFYTDEKEKKKKKSIELLLHWILYCVVNK